MIRRRGAATTAMPKPFQPSDYDEMYPTSATPPLHGTTEEIRSWLGFNQHRLTPTQVEAIRAERAKIVRLRRQAADVSEVTDEDFAALVEIEAALQLPSQAQTDTAALAEERRVLLARIQPAATRQGYSNKATP